MLHGRIADTHAPNVKVRPPNPHTTTTSGGCKWGAAIPTLHLQDKHHRRKLGCLQHMRAQHRH